MYARGMSQRDIAATMREIYGFSMSAETVSAITDRVWEDLERWRSRPSSRSTCSCSSTACTCRCATAAAPATPPSTPCRPTACAGARTSWACGWASRRAPTVGCRCSTSSRAGACATCSTSAPTASPGLARWLASVSPRAAHWRCMVHLVRSSARYVPQKKHMEFCRSVRAVYGLPRTLPARQAAARCPRAPVRLRPPGRLRASRP